MSPLLDPRLNSIMLSIAMVAMGALVWGGVRTYRRGERQKGVLMAVCAAVILGNLLIWNL
jgi:hypothetical protein